MNYPVVYHLHKKKARISHYLYRFAHALYKTDRLEVTGSPSFYRDMLVAIEDASEYLNVDLKGFITLLDEHSTWPQALWDRVGGDVSAFNRHITGDIGRKKYMRQYSLLIYAEKHA